MKYFRNTSWLFGENILRMVAGLFVGIWVARYLGAEQFGLFSYVLAFTAIFGGIAKLGLDGIMVRELINHPEKRDTYLGTAFWLKILGAFIVMGLIASLIPFTSNDANTNLFIFIIAAGLVFQSFEVVEFYFQSQVLAKIVSICKVIQLALSSIIKIYLVLTEAELIWFVLVTAFDALSLAFSYFIAYQLLKNPVFYKHFDLSIAKQLLKDSWPLMLSLISSILYTKIDQIMIKNYLGLEELGYYSSALKLYDGFMSIILILSVSLFPMLLDSKSRGLNNYGSSINRLMFISILFCVPYFLMSLIFSKELISITFGDDFTLASTVLILLGFNTFFASIGMVFIRVLVAENRQGAILKRSLVGLVLNIFLNLIFIPLYGIEGAALATLISFFISHFLLNLFDKSLSKLIFKRH